MRVYQRRRRRRRRQRRRRGGEIDHLRLQNTANRFIDQQAVQGAAAHLVHEILLPMLRASGTNSGTHLYSPPNTFSTPLPLHPPPSYKPLALPFPPPPHPATLLPFGSSKRPQLSSSLEHPTSINPGFSRLFSQTICTHARVYTSVHKQARGSFIELFHLVIAAVLVPGVTGF